MECQAVFEKLKWSFAAEPVLKHPEPNAPFIIQADMSDVVSVDFLEIYAHSCRAPWLFLSTPPENQLTPSNGELFGKRSLMQCSGHSMWKHFLEGSNTPFEVWTV